MTLLFHVDLIPPVEGHGIFKPPGPVFKLFRYKAILYAFHWEIRFDVEYRRSLAIEKNRQEDAAKTEFFPESRKILLSGVNVKYPTRSRVNVLILIFRSYLFISAFV